MISRTDWSELINVVNQKAGVEMPIWKAMSSNYDICHESIITPLSSTIISFYCKLGGTKNETFESLARLPVKYLDGCAVIESEMNRISEFSNGE